MRVEQGPEAGAEAIELAAVATSDVRVCSHYAKKKKSEVSNREFEAPNKVKRLNRNGKNLVLRNKHTPLRNLITMQYALDSSCRSINSALTRVRNYLGGSVNVVVEAR